VPFPMPSQLVDELRQRLDVLHVIILLVTVADRDASPA
jgi:hypothetical protein